MENALFYLTAAGAVVASLGVVLARNPLGSVLALLAGFFCLATIYLLAGFQLLAAAQILVYAGAILVLFLYVIMLLNLGHMGPLPRLDRNMLVSRHSTIALFVATAMLSLVPLSVIHAHPIEAARALPEHGLDETALVARSLFGRYLLPFEATSLLLLATAVAVLVLAKRERKTSG